MDGINAPLRRQREFFIYPIQSPLEGYRGYRIVEDGKTVKFIYISISTPTLRMSVSVHHYK